MSPGRALLRVSGGGGAVAPGHVTAAAGAGVSWRAAAAQSAGTTARSCGVLAATCHRYTRHIISTLGHVLNIYTTFDISYRSHGWSNHLLSCTTDTDYLHTIY